MRGSTGVVALAGLVALCLTASSASGSFPGANGRIVFASNRRADLQLQAFAVPAGGGRPRNVSRRPAYINTDASAGPDGTVVFGSSSVNGFGGLSIWAVGPGGERRLLAHGWAPSLSPDGTRVAYTNPQSEGLFVVPASGGPARQVADSGSPGVWSPDGRWLAVGGNGVLLVRADGLETRRVAEGLSTWPSLPSWSPDSRKVVVSDNDLHILDVATGEETPLGHGTDPAWSPSGALIAFVRARRIATIRPDGSAGRDVTAPPVGEEDQRPVWAPDSTRIAFVRERPAGDVPQAAVLRVLDVRDGDERALSPADGHIVDPYVRGVSWSRDARTIYYSSRSTRDVFHLFTVGANLRGVRQLTRGPGNDREPVWAADGSRVAFVRDGESLVVLDRSRARVVARASGLSSPTWSPDGRLAYAANGAVWIGRRRLVEGSQPAWSPTGRWIAYVRGGLRLVRPNGTGDHWLKADEEGLLFNSPTWSPSGRVVYYISATPCRGDELWACSDLDGNLQAIRPFTQPVSDVPQPAHSGPKPAVSPDGRFLVFGGGMGLSSMPVSGSGTFFGRDSFATETEPDWARVRAQ